MFFKKIYCQLNSDLQRQSLKHWSLCHCVNGPVYSVIFCILCLVKALAVMSLTEACTWTSPILPSVPSMGCPSTVQGLCTQLTCPLHMSLWWGRPLQARWEKNIHFLCGHLSIGLHIDFFVPKQKRSLWRLVTFFNLKNTYIHFTYVQ